MKIEIKSRARIRAVDEELAEEYQARPALPMIGKGGSETPEQRQTEAYDKAMAHLGQQRQITHSYQGKKNERYATKEEINPQIAKAIHLKTDWPEYKAIPYIELKKKL